MNLVSFHVKFLVFSALESLVYAVYLVKLLKFIVLAVLHNETPSLAKNKARFQQSRFGLSNESNGGRLLFLL
ncbi:hypothetical protein AT705_03680 [Pseudoalteromonas rubra]|uniref:Uncharacterized protein n=1 Tax=Pseudoalteromonas rubra TaxID=43658 RepID=A0A0U2Z2Y1_9GAMM|nr:hypothetical protein AT705_03680 [Pseudoalteromonas rubra]